MADAGEGQGPMSEEEVQSLISGVVTDCIQYADGELSPIRAKATDYYLGKPFGNEEEGRSQVVLTPVRDVVLGILPSLLRVFFGPERVVEFVPRNASETEAAAQASDYVQYVFAEAEGGFLKTHSVLKDGLVRRMGIFKWGWDASAAPRGYKLSGVTEEELEALAGDDEVTLLSVVSETPELAAPEQETPELAAPEPGPAPAPQPGMPQPGMPQPGMPQPGMPEPLPEPRYAVELKHTDSAGKPRVWTVPPEELIFTREARDTSDALLIGHRMERTRGELLSLGVSAEDIEQYATEDSSLRSSPEELARRGLGASGWSATPEAGEANDRTLFIEAYARMDVDGDGIAELRRFWLLGPGYQVVLNEPADEVPFAIFCPDPEPHTLVGQSLADRTMDVQLTTSSLIRATLDSLAASIYPRTAYVEGQVSVEDVLNTAIGAPIRMRTPGAVQPFAHDFVGREAMPFFQYFDDVVERRTGQNKGAAGLDADALQSSTKSAVGAAISASQAQAEMLARIFAETALKPLFRGILRLLVTHQPRASMVRLRGRWVEVDPRAWSADMDVSVNVALGSGLLEEKIATLAGIAAKMEQIFATFGPVNPVVTLSQYSALLKRTAELQGYKDASQFFNDVDPAWQPPPPPPPGPTPEQTLAEAQLKTEQMKTERELAMKAEELDFKRRLALLEHERQVAAQSADIELRRYELELKYQASVPGPQFDAGVERERSLVDGALAEASMAEEGQEAQQAAEAEQMQQMPQAPDPQQQEMPQAPDPKQQEMPPMPGGGEAPGEMTNG